jgi:hypothetical protein
MIMRTIHLGHKRAVVLYNDKIFKLRNDLVDNSPDLKLSTFGDNDNSFFLDSEGNNLATRKHPRSTEVDRQLSKRSFCPDGSLNENLTGVEFRL